MQSNNQLTDNISSVGCMNCLYVCLCAKFEILQTTCCLWVVHALMPTEFAPSVVLGDPDASRWTECVPCGAAEAVRVLCLMCAFSCIYLLVVRTWLPGWCFWISKAIAFYSIVRFCLIGNNVFSRLISLALLGIFLIEGSKHFGTD
jgi:hypothetical protein